VVYLRLQDSDFISGFQVKGSEDTIRMNDKGSVSGTGSRQGEGRENRFNRKS